MIGSVTDARAVIAAVALLLGVTACSGDDPEPIIAPTPSSSAPSDPSTSPVSAALGPEETFKAWVDAYNQALETGDTSAVEALSTTSCRTCRNAITPVERVYADGGHFDTDGWIIVASRVKSRSGDVASLSAGIKYAAGETVPRAGAEPVVYAVERHIVVVDLVEDDGRWRVQFIGYLS
jgi:hypothetical protein